MAKPLEKEIDLRRLFQLIRRRLWIVMVTTIILTTLGSVYVSMPRTPLYESSTRIFLQTNSDLFNTLRVIIKEPIVLDQVVNDLKLRRSAEALRGQISVTNIDESTVMRISVVDQDPALAADIANAIVTSYQRVAHKY